MRPERSEPGGLCLANSKFLGTFRIPPACDEAAWARSGRPVSLGGVRRVEVEAFEHERHHVALRLEGGFDFAAQPIAWLAAPFKCGRRQQDKEMCPSIDIFKDDTLKVPTAGSILPRRAASIRAVEPESSRAFTLAPN